MPKAVVAMFCGPHDEGSRIPHRRINRAVEYALARGLPLVIAGDAFDGTEARYFKTLAKKRGVQMVLVAFDPQTRNCTLSDAQATIIQLQALGLDISRVYLVTDWWHMLRSSVMMIGEIHTRHPARVVPVPVFNGPFPCLRTLWNELRGSWHYLTGTYGQRTVNDPLRHTS